MKPFLFLLFAAFLLPSCNQEQKKLENLQKETNDLHDQAMKDMADMDRSARAIKEFMKTATLSQEDSVKYAGVLAAVGTAENNMMTWMTQYQEPAGKPAAEAIQYLEAQKTVLLKSRKEINDATEAAKKILGK